MLPVSLTRLARSEDSPITVRLRGAPLRRHLFSLKLVQIKAKQLGILELKFQAHNLS